MNKVKYQIVKKIIKDRYASTGFISMLLASIVMSTVLAFNIKPSELKVSIHYTSFGGEYIYRGQWFYLISFVVFGIVIAVIHSILFAKIYQLKGRNMALLFIYASVFILLIAMIVLYKVVTIASLT